MLYNQKDSIITSVTCILGVKPDSGIVNTFNEMEDKGLLDGCYTIGDYTLTFLEYRSQQIKDMQEETNREAANGN